jgi:DNA polymerase I-like protein with 3'-5' exonuclease and polymerase domains
LGLRPWHFFDTFLSEKVLFCGLVDKYASDFWGLEDVVRKYCGLHIDKGLQKTFDLFSPLTPEQIVYCAMDTRLPLAVRNGQRKRIKKELLEEASQIEYDAIPAFGDMRLNGFLQDKAAWLKLSDDNDLELIETITQMDTFAIPIVGDARNKPSEELLQQLEEEWKLLTVPSAQEEMLTEQIKAHRSKVDTEKRLALMAERDQLQETRKKQRDINRKKYQTHKSSITDWNNDAAKWEGKACINYNGGAQLRKMMLAGKFGFTEKNLPNTNDDTLEKHAEKPIVKALRKYRKLKKYKTTYGQNWLRLVNDPNEPGYTDPYTYRLHANIDQLGADTGRTTSNTPNLQNLPKDDKYRACFIARPGYKMATIDYNGQELRVLAQLSGERAWIEAFRKNWDVHSVCAELLYGVEWKKAAVHQPYVVKDPKTGLDVLDKKGNPKVIPRCAYYYADTQLDNFGRPSKDSGLFFDHQKCHCPEHETMRSWLKNINFGVAYGKVAFSLAGDLEITLEQAEELLRKYRKAFPMLSKYLDNIAMSGFQKLESRTLSGRRRAYERPTWEQAVALAPDKDWVKAKMKKEGRTTPTDAEIRSVYGSICRHIQRCCKNTPVQGTGADMVKLAVGCGFDENGKPYLWHLLEPEFGGLLENLVHDEIVFEAPEDKIEGAYIAADDAMCRAGAHFIRVIPVTTDGHIDTRWRK